MDGPQGLYSLSGKTSYRKISWSLEAARFGFKLFQLLWNLAGTSAALLPRCLSNFRAIRPLQHPISRLRDFTRFGGKTSYRLVNRGPGWLWKWHRKKHGCIIKLPNVSVICNYSPITSRKLIHGWFITCHSYVAKWFLIWYFRSVEQQLMGSCEMRRYL